MITDFLLTLLNNARNEFLEEFWREKSHPDELLLN